MKDTITRLLLSIKEWGYFSAIRNEDIPLFTYEILYIIYLSKKENKELNINESKNIIELINQVIKINDEIKNTKKGDLLLEIKEELTKFKYVDLNYIMLFKTLKNINTEDIKEIMKIDISEFFEFYSLISGRRGDFSTIESISTLVNNILAIKADESILDMCSGNGNFLAKASSSNATLYGVDINFQASLIAKIRLSILTDKEDIIKVADALTNNYETKYDKIFCNHPLGLRIDNYKLGEIKNKKDLFYSWENYPGSSSDWLFVNNVISLLKPDGKAIIVMTDGALFKTADKIYKTDLLVDGMIEAIIKLPCNILATTTISVNLVVLSNKANKEVKFVDATEEAIKNKRSSDILIDNVINLLNGPDNEKVKTIKVADILDNDTILSVNNYVGKKEIKYHSPHKLTEYLIDRFRGYQMTSSEQEKLKDPNGKYEILTISDIDNGKIKSSLTKINADDNRLDRYLVQNGDVIISSKGTRIKIATAEIGDRKIIANGNLIVLRIDQQKLNPFYLEMYLNSSDGQSILKGIQTGTVIISINPSKLETITISTLPFEEQNKIAIKYRAKQKQITLAQEHIKKLESELDSFFEDEVEVLFN